MDEGRPHELQPERFDRFEDEIELMDYLKVLWKWRYLVLVGTLVCAVAAAVISLNMTKVYGIETVIQPGILRVTEDGKISYIDSPQNIKSLIETGAFDDQVLKNPNVSGKEDLPEELEFDATIPKKTNAVEVLYKTPDVDIGLRIVDNLNKALSKRYGNLINYYQKNYDNEIRSKLNEGLKLNEKTTKAMHAISTAETKKDEALEQKANKRATMQAQIDAKNKQIRNLNQRISDVELELNRVAKNTDLMIEERNRFLASKETEKNILASVIYSNTIQQNISYLNSLRSSISSTNHQIFQENVGIEQLGNGIKDLETEQESLVKLTRYEVEALKSEMEDLETEKEFIQEEINGIKFKKNNIQNIQIIKPPKRSISPIKPKIRLNVMLAGVVGLFLTLFLAFFIEYVSRYKTRESD